MTALHHPETDSLQDLFWQDELTEAIWWLSEARPAEPVEAATLEQILWPGAGLVRGRLQHLVDKGLVRPVSTTMFALTERGRARGRALLEADKLDALRPRDCCSSAQGGCSCCSHPGIDVA